MNSERRFPNVLYRALRASDDLQVITDLLHEAYAPLAAAGMRYVASHQDVTVTKTRMSAGETFVATDGDVIVGVITLKDAAATYGSAFYDRADVADFDLAVRPAYQHCGIGSRLIDMVESRAWEKGVLELALNTSEHAAGLIDMYQRKGFHNSRDEIRVIDDIEDRFQLPELEHFADPVQ